MMIIVMLSTKPIVSFFLHRLWLKIFISTQDVILFILYIQSLFSKMIEIVSCMTLLSYFRIA